MRSMFRALVPTLLLAVPGCADIIEQGAPAVREALRTSIGGRVELESLGPCGGLELQLVGPDGPRAATTNADGAWSLDEATIGAWTVRATVDGFQTAEAVFVAAAGEAVNVGLLRLALPRVPVRGRVALEDGDPAVGAAVAAEAEVVAAAPEGLSCGGGGPVPWRAAVLVGPDGWWELEAPAMLDELAARIRREGFTEADVAVAGADLAAAAAAGTTVEAPAATLYPLTGFVNVVGPTIRADRDVPLQISAFNGVSEMALGEVDGAGVCALGEWVAYDAAATFTVGAGDGLHTICVRVRDDRGQSFGPMYVQVEVDGAAPSGSLIIDLGASTTASPIVALGLTAGDTGSGVVGVRLANDEAALPTTSTVSYEATKIWTLAAPNGPGVEATRAVWMQVVDAAGNASVPVSATILLDRAAPRALTLDLPSAGGGSRATPGWSASSIVAIQVTATDPGLGDGRGALRAAPPASLAETAWQPWANWIVATLPSQNGPQEVRVEVRDAAGNVAAPASACLMLDTQAPEITALQAAGSGSDPGYARGTSIELVIDAIDNLADTADLEVCIDGDLESLPVRCEDPLATWSAWQPTRALTLAAVPAGTSAARELRVTLRDPANNRSSTGRETVIVDREIPGAVAWQAAAAGAGRVDLSWSAVDGAVRYRVDYDGVDIAADAMAGSGLVEGASPRIVTGTTVRLTGLRSFEPVFFRVRPIDAAGNIGADPGASARATSALISLDTSLPNLGCGGDDGLPDLALRRDAAGNLWTAYRGTAGRTILARCPAPCDDGSAWMAFDAMLGYGSTAGISQSLLVEGRRVWLAEIRPGSEDVRVGMCDDSHVDCLAAPWRYLQGAAAWAVTIDASFFTGIEHARVRLARDDAGTLWMSASGMTIGTDNTLWILSCADVQGACSGPMNWAYTQLDRIVGDGYVHSDLTWADGTLWLLVTHRADQSAWLWTCRPLELDCTDEGNWQATALPGDVGANTTTQGMAAKIEVMPRAGSGIRAVVALPGNQDPTPNFMTPIKYVAVCEAASSADCRDAGAWQHWTKWGGGAFGLSLQADRVLLVEHDTFFNRFVSSVCRTDCGLQANWRLGPAWEDASLSVASIALLGWGEGNVHLAHANLFAGIRLLRPLLLPPADHDLLLIPGGMRASWTAAAGNGYGLALNVDGASNQAIELADPGQLQLDLQIEADRAVSTAVRTTSALGQSEAGPARQASTPRVFPIGLPTVVNGGVPGNDSYRTGAMAAAGERRAVIVDSGGRLEIRACDTDCDGGAGVWAVHALASPGGNIVWVDLVGDEAGFFGLIRTAAPDASAHDLWALRCEGTCATGGDWKIGEVRMSDGAWPRPGWAARAAIGAGQLWVAHVADEFAPLPIEYLHGGPLEIRRCDQGIGCPDAGDWAALTLADAPGQTTWDAHVAIAASDRAVWLLRASGPVISLSECVHDGAPALCDGSGGWTHGQIRNSSYYGDGYEPWGSLRKYEEAMALAFDPATSTLFAFAEAADWPAEQSSNALLACRWAGAGSCSDNDDWRRIWPTADVAFPLFVLRGALLVSPRRVDLTFFVWSDLYHLGCEGDCDDSANWSPLARIADGASYEVGTAVFGDGRVGWIGGGMARTARLGPGRF